MKEFLAEIPERLRSTITHFTTDMWEGYLNAISEYISENDDVAATPVVDRFHVAQNYREDFDDLRKQELKRLKSELPSETYNKDCKNMLWTLRKNHSALNPDECEKLRRFFSHSPSLHQSYTFREELTAIFNQELSIPQAEHRLHSWIHKVEQSPLNNFDGFIKTLRNHWTYIVNYFEKRITSGFVEGLNNKIKTITRRCYGIRNVSNLFQRIWLDLNGKELFSLSTT